jgi:hypothetical protein
MSDDKTQYRVFGDLPKVKQANAEQRVLDVLPDQAPGLSESEILAEIGENAKQQDFKAPSRSTVQRAIEKLVQNGYVLESRSEGRRGGNDHLPSSRYFVSNTSF